MPHHRKRLAGIFFLSGLILMPSPGRTAVGAALGVDGEVIISTPLPDNALSFIALSGGWDELGIYSHFVSIAPDRSPAVLPIRKTFWKTAETSLFISSLISFAGMNVADYVLTREAQKYPESRETNPIFRPIVSNAWTLALYKIGSVSLNTLSLYNLYQHDKPVAWAISLVTNLLAALAVTHLAADLDKIKNR